MTIKRYVGADGCKAGWFAVVISSDDSCEFGIFEAIEDLWRAYQNAVAILIDIPIGLNSEGNINRTCDALARNVLKPLRHNSVFTAPFRETLSAKSYKEACRINQNLCGKKLSQQAWNISDKIKQVDGFLEFTPNTKGRLRETHPEVCFWALNGFVPMKHNKKSAEGQAARLDLLMEAYPYASAVYKAALDRYPRKDLAPDDILDALVNAVTATLLEKAEGTLPADPPRDERGLPIEMVYARPPSQHG